MINVVLYLSQNHNPIDVVEQLLRKELVASAFVDYNNESYSLKEGVLVKTLNHVITVQTKQLLFSEIVKFIAVNYGQDIAINSVPIVSANDYFDSMIRVNTKKI
ncbi:MAG: hypothetical protein J0M08_01860 [Bacteroidetes bacterium]|nr:hypothetical protein [Bacteroidota bacterium]